MSTPGSVTLFVSELKAGNRDAAQVLWERYFTRLVGLARTRLAKNQRRAADEEDVALSAFDSFCRGAEQGRFPLLTDRNNLWPLLVLITERKAIDLVHHNHAQKRGGGRVQGESAFVHQSPSTSTGAGIGNVPAPEPTPEFAYQVVDKCERLLARLGEEKLRHIALMKLEGYTDKEVATQLGLSLRTVERKLERIRRTWEKEMTR